MNAVLIWLFLFFGFVVALVLFAKPAPEQQQIDDALGYLRDHSEVRMANIPSFRLLFFPINSISFGKNKLFSISLPLIFSVSPLICHAFYASFFSQTNQLTSAGATGFFLANSNAIN